MIEERKINPVEVASDFLIKANWEQVAILKTDNERNRVINCNSTVLTLILGLGYLTEDIKQLIMNRLNEYFENSGEKDKPVERIVNASRFCPEERRWDVLSLLGGLPKEELDYDELVVCRDTNSLVIRMVVEKMLMENFRDELPVDFIATFEPTQEVLLLWLEKDNGTLVTVGNLKLFQPLLEFDRPKDVEPVLKWFRHLPKSEENKLLLQHQLQEKMSIKTDLCIAVLLEQYGDELKKETIGRIVQLAEGYFWRLYFFKDWENWCQNPSLTDYEILEINQEFSENSKLLRCFAWQRRLLSSFGVGVGLVVLDSWTNSYNPEIVREASRLFAETIKSFPISTLVGMLKNIRNNVEATETEIWNRQKDGKLSGQDFEGLIKLAIDDDCRIQERACSVARSIPVEEVVAVYGYGNLLELVDGPRGEGLRGQLIDLVYWIAHRIPTSAHKENWSTLMELLFHENDYTRDCAIGTIQRTFTSIFGEGRHGFRTCWKFFEKTTPENKPFFGWILLNKYSTHLSNTRLKKLALKKSLKGNAEKILLIRALEGKIKVSF